MLTRLSMIAMLEGLKNGKFSARELLEAHHSRIAAVNPKVNAFVRILDEFPAPQTGPIHGIPVTVKDSFDLAGLPTTCGSKFRQTHRASKDSTAASRLRRAGAVILGKTNTPEFLANYETDNHIVGRTNNPWSLDRTPGGSSGGESAAIAAGMSAGGIGSDGGGSVRLPAHFCGIAALKPTPGRVSAAGHFPAIHHPGGLLGVAGPMARTAADVRLLFEVLEGYDPADPFSAPVAPTADRLAPFRVGVMEQFNGVPVQTAVAKAVAEATRLLGEAQVPVEAFEASGLERAPNLWSFFFTELNIPFTRDLLSGREEEAHWTGTEFYLKLKDRPDPTGKQVVENLAARDGMRARMLEQMEETPVLLSPVCSTTAFAHRERRYSTSGKDIGLFQSMMPLTWVNLLGFPAVTIPIMIEEEGLPVGVQLIGRPWEEERLLDLAVALEHIRGPFPQPQL